MKLPSRPAPRPSGHSGATKSVTSSQRLVAPAREDPQRDQHAEEAAVEAHPAVPHLEDLERMRGVVERLVEQHVAEPPAEDHAEDAEEQHVVDVGQPPSGQHLLPRADAPEHDDQHERRAGT